MNKSVITAEIDGTVMAETHKDYRYWTIGVTDNTSQRKSQHDSNDKNTKFWQHWNADSEEDARDIEKHFLDKGMKGDTGGGGRADYVYIF